MRCIFCTPNSAELILQTHFYQICIYLYVLSIQVEDEEDQPLLQASIKQFEEAALEQKRASLREADLDSEDEEVCILFTIPLFDCIVFTDPFLSVIYLCVLSVDGR